MNTTKVQLPNGNLMTIEGGDAEQVAHILSNHLAQSAPFGSEAEHDETALAMPVMNFHEHTPASPIQILADGEEAAMEVPRVVA